MSHDILFYDLLAINYLLANGRWSLINVQLIVDFYNETYRQRYGSDVSDGTLTMLWSLTTALFIPGGMIGSLLGGWLADAIGR